MAAISGSAQRVEDALAARGMAGRVRVLADSTRSAAEAAAAIGCDIAQIVKSLVFRGEPSGKAVLVLASGRNRVDESLLAGIVGETVKRASPDFVRAATGFAIGGVAPLAHPGPLHAVVDRDLLQLDPLWAAAGTPLAVFRLSARELIELTGGTVAEIRAG